ncbi:hypothetical protein MRX96_011135 [Rhipicephalus microplus]
MRAALPVKAFTIRQLLSRLEPPHPLVPRHGCLAPLGRSAVNTALQDNNRSVMAKLHKGAVISRCAVLVLRDGQFPKSLPSWETTLHSHPSEPLSDCGLRIPNVRMQWRHFSNLIGPPAFHLAKFDILVASLYKVAIATSCS